jgi:hypothetical protein
MPVVKLALLSVSDKAGIVEFARGLAGRGVGLISTGGTAALLRDAGLPVTEVADHTGFPEMLDGRVKTLHPKVHGGILARRDVPAHVTKLAAAGIPLIDLVAVNLYPFRETIARPGCTLPDAIENIDIGGPAMVRSAAKNYEHVAVVTDPADYDSLLRELSASGGSVGAETRFRLAQKAFSHTAAYDGAISNYLTALEASGARAPFPRRLNLQFDLAQPLRYGENPHQAACVLPRSRAGAGEPGELPPGAGEGAFLQQYRRRRCGLGMRERFRADRLRHRQARQSLRRSRCRDGGGSLRQGVRYRSDVGVRGHHRFQLRAERSVRPGRHATVRRGRDCAGHGCRGGRGTVGQGRMSAC